MELIIQRKHTEEAIDQRGEVFTPSCLVNEMLNKLPQDVLLNPEKVIGDIAGCGNGNFLIEVLKRRTSRKYRPFGHT